MARRSRAAARGKNPALQGPFPPSLAEPLKGPTLCGASFYAQPEGSGNMSLACCDMFPLTALPVGLLSKPYARKDLTMAKRHKMPARQSRRHFTRHAMRAHPKNTTAGPMRGGIRL